MSAAIQKKDNSSPARKIYLRKKYLPKNAVILDCFCGSGIIYRGCYEGVKEYHGLDKNKVHDSALCEIANNQVWIRKNDINKFNVFDLDDYGTPWVLLFAILKKTNQKEITVFVTDGLVLHTKLTGKIPRIISATERIPRNFIIPGIFHFYDDIIKTLFLRIESECGYTVSKAVSIPNEANTVRYWYLKLVKKDGGKNYSDTIVSSPEKQHDHTLICPKKEGGIKGRSNNPHKTAKTLK